MPEPTATDHVQFDFQTAQRVVRAVRTVEQLSGKQTGNGGRGSSPQYAPPVIIRIRNDSGEDREKFQVLCINEVVGTTAQDTDEQARQIYFSCINPNTGVARHVPCVLLQDCRRNDYADAVLSGVCIANVNITSTSHDWVELVNGDATKLQSASSGAGRILTPPNGTGEKLTPVMLGAGGGGGSTLSFGYGKTDATSSLDATVTVSVWSPMGAAGSDSGTNITAYNRIGAIASGKFVFWMGDGTGYDIIQARC